MQKVFCRLAFLLAGLAGLLSAAGCSPVGSSGYAAYQEAAALPAVNHPYILHTNDQLHVQVYSEQTITGDYVVDSTGYLSIPVAGRVKAAGLTVQQLERRVTAQLNGAILKDARVNIQIATYAPFYIRGEVKKPGEFPYKPGLTVADAVALAGGYTYRADENRVVVRPSGSNAELTRPTDANPPVSPGDNITVPERFL
ncbi:MAG: polysaccharide biosynthesis/export family protein [Pseudolabrys sp.]|jgi:polysaccharide export outer membrane protein